MQPGIYVITNTVTHKVYVGQAVNIRRRWNDHKAHLRRGVHANKYLQSAWNKYGEALFLFEVVENCPVADLVAREQEWVSFFPQSLRYNIGSIGAPMRGRKHTPEAIQKMKAPKSKEVAVKISKALTGKKHTPEHARKTGLAKRKAVRVRGTNIVFDSIKDAAAFAGVHVNNLRENLYGRSRTCKGYVFEFV